MTNNGVYFCDIRKNQFLLLFYMFAIVIIWVNYSVVFRS